MSIQSKLLLMLLSVSLLSAVIVGYIGFVNGRDSLRQAAIEQLTTVRELRAEEIRTTFLGIQKGVRLESRTADAVRGSRDFNKGFEDLRERPVPSELAGRLDAYYEQQFIPALEEHSGTDYDVKSLLPTTNAGRYLQAAYTASRKDFNAALGVSDAGDNSQWSKAHAEHHSYFKGLVDELGYKDVLLLNTTGDVVYSAYKGTDLGMNILAAPFANSQLSNAYREIMRTNTVDALATTDFERYLPSLNRPTVWIVSPVGSSGQITGALAVQIPTDTINAVMTGDGNWAGQGLGQTGEAYLVGEDRLMRSLSRPLVDDPDAYVTQAIESGTSPETAKRIAAVKGTVLLQEVRTEPVSSALLGHAGDSVSRDYLGRESLTSYGPLDLDGPRWVIVASITAAEAFAPVDTFTRTIVLSIAGLVLVITLLSMLLARAFTRPLDRLIRGVNRVGAGERDVEVDPGTRDEFGQLGAAFNDMSRSLQVKADLLDGQLAENDRLLLTVMPEKLVHRYRQGDTTISDDHQDVTVICADIVGFDDLSHGLESQESLTLLNEIFASFDEAAERIGVEQVRTTKQGYLASCGLLTPRVDSTRRTVEFGKEIDAILRRLGAQHGYRLSLRAGIDTGRVTSGLIGTSAVVYDMWGEAVSLAYQLQGFGTEPGIYLTQRAAERLPDKTVLAESGTIQARQGAETYWRVDTEAAHV